MNKTTAGNRMHRRKLLAAASGFAVACTVEPPTIGAQSLLPEGNQAEPYAGHYFGCAYGSGDLGNTRFQTYHAHRFICEMSGNVTKIKWLSPLRSGYYAGNGGNIIVHICEDAGGVPDLDRKLGSTPLQVAAHNLGEAPLVSFQAPIPLTFGTIYHIVWQQMAPDDGWLSIDDLWSFGPSTPRSAYPFQGDILASLMHIPSTGKFMLRGQQVPIHELHYSNGIVKGQGYTFGANSERRLIDGPNMARQLFVAPETMRVDSVWLWLWRLGSGAGNLNVQLRDGATDVILATTTIERARVAVSCQDPGCSTPVQWVNRPFASPVTFQAEQTYHCVLSAPDGAQFVACPNWKSFWNGFSADSIWRNAYAQFSTDGGSSWAGWSLWGQRNRTDLDMPMLFRRV